MLISVKESTDKGIFVSAIIPGMIVLGSDIADDKTIDETLAILENRIDTDTIRELNG